MALDEQSRYPVTCAEVHVPLPHPAIVSRTSGLFLKACFLFPTEVASNSMREVRLGVRVGAEKGGEVGMG